MLHITLTIGRFGGAQFNNFHFTAVDRNHGGSISGEVEVVVVFYDVHGRDRQGIKETSSVN